MPADVGGVENAPKSQTCKHLLPCEELPADDGRRREEAPLNRMTEIADFRRGGRFYRPLALALGWRGGVFPLWRPATSPTCLGCYLRCSSVLPPFYLRPTSVGRTEEQRR